MLFKQIHVDDPLLIPFTEECGRRDISNNNSIKNLKFDYFKHSAFFGGIQDNCIKVFSGTHPMEINGKEYWRVGFRGVALYDELYKPSTHKNFRRSSFCAGITFVLAMKWVEHHFGSSEFVMTTNIDPVSDKSRSNAMDKLSKHGVRNTGWSLLYEDITYLSTRQNVWSIDKQLFYSDFDKYHKDNHEFQIEVL
jgi:hypothetical protein